MPNLSSDLFDLARRRNTRIFFQGSDDGSLNVEVWKNGIKALRLNDAVGACHAMTHARGDVEVISRRGTPRSNPLAKAILALKANPDAWSRLREATETRMFPTDPAVSDADWVPVHVNIIAFLWAANPALLAQASKLWRIEREKDQKWWSCPMLGQNGYDFRTDLRSELRPALSRLYPEARSSQVELPSTPPIQRVGEREAMADILTEATKACILQLFAHERRASEHRAKGERVYARGGSEWGLRWFGTGINLLAPSPESILPTERAVRELIADAAAVSNEKRDDTTRLCALSLHAEHARLAGVAMEQWAQFNPNAQTLPLGRHDWISPASLNKVIAGSGIDDEALGSWLHETGRFWSYPAAPNYNDALMPAQPTWHISHQPGWREFKAWTPLEWTIFSRPLAVRHACLLGAKLADGFENDFHRISAAHVLDSSKINTAAMIDACRIAETLPASAVSCPQRSPRL